MATIHAIYEKGVFRPIGPVNLPDPCEVQFEPQLVADEAAEDAILEGIRSVLAERYDSGEHDVAERHNEHQP